MAVDWAPFAIRREGPDWKRGYAGHGFNGPKRGDVKHSAEGSEGGLWSVLDGPRRASWHFSVMKDGRVFQHYSLLTHCWHAGDVDADDNVSANLELIGIEHEGVAGETLTNAQIEATLRITRWAAEQVGRHRFARFPAVNSDVWLLVEHNEVANTYTACPSNRIPWPRILAALKPQPQPAPPEEEDEEMKQRMEVAGLFQAVAGKLDLDVAIPTKDVTALGYLLGGTSPHRQTTRETLAVLYRYAAGQALRGEPLDEDTRLRLRHAI